MKVEGDRGAAKARGERKSEEDERERLLREEESRKAEHARIRKEIVEDAR